MVAAAVFATAAVAHNYYNYPLSENNNHQKKDVFERRMEGRRSEKERQKFVLSSASPPSLTVNGKHLFLIYQLSLSLSQLSRSVYSLADTHYSLPVCALLLNYYNLSVTTFCVIILQLAPFLCHCLISPTATTNISFFLVAYDFDNF